MLTTIPLTNIGAGFGAEIQDFTEFNGTGYFIAAAAGQPDNLWATDGTAAGTMPVTNFVNADVDHLTRVNNTLYFSLRHGNSQVAEGLWKSDGTSRGTMHVREFVSISEMINNDGVLYFGGRDYRGTELWKSDGTFSGTELVKEFVPGPMGSSLRDLQIFNQKVAFTAHSGFPKSGQSTRLGLWISDGTEAGTHELFGHEALALSFDGPILATPDGIFAENITEGDSYLWISDGTSTGRPLVVDPEPTPGRDVDAENLTWFDGRVFFSRVNMEGLWITDLATADTTMLDLDVTVEDIIATDTGVYFVGNDIVNGREIWKSDGTFGGTQRLTNFETPDGANVVPDTLRTDGVRLYFLADLQWNTARGQNYHIYQMQPNSDGTYTSVELDTTASQPTGVVSLPPSFDQVFEPFDGRFLYIDNDGSDVFNLWSVSAEITASPTDNPLKFLQPKDRIRQQYPEFSWSSVRSAVSYELWVGLNGTTTPVINETISSTKYVSDHPLPPGRYTAWVRETLGDGTIGVWQPQSFQVAKAPRLHHPVSPTDNVRPVIEWDPIPGATGYRVFVNNSTAQQNPVIDEIVTGTSLTPSFDFSMGRHRVWVAALGAGNFQGYWSAPIIIDVAPAASLSPWATTNVRPVFSWSAVPDASAYQIYIAGTGGFTIIESNISGTTFTPQTDLAAGSYRWWIRGITSAPRFGPWSDLNELYVGGMTKVEVVTHYSDTTPTLTWPEVPGATSYEVYLTGRDASNDPSVYRQAGLTGTTFTTLPLIDSDEFWQYQVWIRTTLADDSQQWGPATDFAILSVHAGSHGDGPTLLGTTRTTFDGLPEFIWVAEPGTGEYEIFLHTPEEQIHFEDVQGTFDEGRLFWTPPTPLTAHATDWKMFIRYIDELGQPAGWGRGEDFHSGGRPRVLSTSIFPAIPPVIPFDSVSINWIQVREATDYEIYITNLSTGDRGVVQELAGVSGTWVSSTNLPSDQYRVWVRAIANAAMSPWSLPFDFEIPV